MQRIVRNLEDPQKRDIHMEMATVIQSRITEKVNLDVNLVGEHDSFVVPNVLEPEEADAMFQQIRDETRWQKMLHLGGVIPRLIAVQAEIASDGSIPVYRHPGDELPEVSPFSPTLQFVREQVERILGHSVNHVLIQFYRTGADSISEHSDKTLDIVPNTFIGNFSLGAQRTLVLRTKNSPLPPENLVLQGASSRQVHRVVLPHNSLFVMGRATNQCWLHGIRPDRRLKNLKMTEETAFDASRISLTFRMIGTFLNKDHTIIWGQGATAKEKTNGRTVKNGKSAEAERMIQAFSKENHDRYFDWGQNYGSGFDVVNIISL